MVVKLPVRSTNREFSPRQWGRSKPNCYWFGVRSTRRTRQQEKTADSFVGVQTNRPTINGRCAARRLWKKLRKEIRGLLLILPRLASDRKTSEAQASKMPVDMIRAKPSSAPNPLELSTHNVLMGYRGYTESHSDGSGRKIHKSEQVRLDVTRRTPTSHTVGRNENGVVVLNTRGRRMLLRATRGSSVDEKSLAKIAKLPHFVKEAIRRGDYTQPEFNTAYLAHVKRIEDLARKALEKPSPVGPIRTNTPCPNCKAVRWTMRADFTATCQKCHLIFDRVNQQRVQGDLLH